MSSVMVLAKIVGNRIFASKSCSGALMRNIRSTNFLLYNSFHSSCRCLFEMNNNRLINKQFFHETISKTELLRYTSVRCTQKDALHVNTNVQNNVLLFKYERERYFRYMYLFCYGQAIIWFGGIYLNYGTDIWNLLTTSMTFTEYITNNSVTAAFFPMVLLCAIALFRAPIFVNTRYVKYLILNKGGDEITVVTYHPSKSKAAFTIPVSEIKTKYAREKITTYLPVKIRGRPLYYIVDGEGTFVNGKLFDYTVGLQKNW